jgi:hypothetical protein
MNRCIVSKLLDQSLVARIDPEPCDRVQLACACLRTQHLLDLQHPRSDRVVCLGLKLIMMILQT